VEKFLFSSEQKRENKGDGSLQEKLKDL